MIYATRVNSKSDVSAKHAFIEHLLTNQGFDEARVTRTPADITAMKHGERFYFEIKYTQQTTNYFGAATLTEWESALAHEQHYRFVIARQIAEVWEFREYSPAEFILFSYIPPFKVFFNVPVDGRRETRNVVASKRVPMNTSRMKEMLDLYKRFRQ